MKMQELNKAYGTFNDFGTKAFSKQMNKVIPNSSMKNEKKANAGRDTVEITADAYELQTELNASSGPDDLFIERGKSDNSFVIHFDNVAIAHRVVDRGYITVNGQNIQLTDEIKEKIIKTSEEAFKANERATLEYAARHNMIVAKQQAEARAEESKRMSRAMEIMSKMASGAKVSKEDLQFLKEYNPEMYAMALNAAMMAERKEMQEEKHPVKQHKDSVTNEPSEDYTKELEELKNTFTETTLTVSFENGVSFGEVSTVTSEY